MYTFLSHLYTLCFLCTVIYHRQVCCFSFNFLFCFCFICSTLLVIAVVLFVGTILLVLWIAYKQRSIRRMLQTTQSIVHSSTSTSPARVPPSQAHDLFTIDEDPEEIDIWHVPPPISHQPKPTAPVMSPDTASASTSSSANPQKNAPTISPASASTSSAANPWKNDEDLTELKTFVPTVFQRAQFSPPMTSTPMKQKYSETKFESSSERDITFPKMRALQATDGSVQEGEQVGSVQEGEQVGSVQEGEQVVENVITENEGRVSDTVSGTVSRTEEEEEEDGGEGDINKSDVTSDSTADTTTNSQQAFMTPSNPFRHEGGASSAVGSAARRILRNLPRLSYKE